MKLLWEKRRTEGFRFKERDVSDYIGKKFGNLTIVSLLPIKKGQGRIWLCKCDCGQTKEVRTTNLKNGFVQSCGCLNQRGLPKGESGARHLYRHYVFSAKRRKIPFNISLENFKILTSKNCTYCDTPPLKIVKSYDAKSSHSFYHYNGLDRINPSRGYTLDNVEPCCTICNIMKWTFSKEDFLGHLIKILKVQKVKGTIDANLLLSEPPSINPS